MFQFVSIALLICQIGGAFLTAVKCDPSKDQLNVQGALCGINPGNGLSVIDADKHNQQLDCQGCHSHRWLTPSDAVNNPIYDFPVYGQSADGHPVYLCRTIIGGEMTPGKFRLDQNVCYVGLSGREYGINGGSQQIEVLVTKKYRCVGLGNVCEQLYPPYSFASVGSWSEQSLIPVGNTADGRNVIYAAASTVNINGMTERALGKIYGNDLTRAYIPFGFVEYTVSNFTILSCEKFICF